MTLAATTGIPKHFSGLASGILNTSQQVGGAIGLAVLSAVAASATTHAMATDHALDPAQARIDGFHSAFFTAIGFALFAALIVAVVVRNQKAKPNIAPAV